MSDEQGSFTCPQVASGQNQVLEAQAGSVNFEDAVPVQDPKIEKGKETKLVL